MFFRKPRYEKTAVIFIPMLFFTNHKTKTLKKGYARSTYYVVQVHALVDFSFMCKTYVNRIHRYPIQLVLFIGLILTYFLFISGILLSHSYEEGLWVYNRTQSPIFVNSPTLEPPPPLHNADLDSNNYPFSVIKVLPGFSIQVFDYEKSLIYEKIRQPLNGPFDPYSIRISFAKGWGGKYSRQVVTNCPCWLEILLAVSR